MKGQPSYTVEEEMDATRPYLKHIYVTINNLEYELQIILQFRLSAEYVVKGSLTMNVK
ncbi:hypothetical protein [Bacteroides thetaiotaomicron]|uniref:hypothetical protein n=1 Tax=Bacteroides thetaiotaomicron TaxID=818 RepID=UPI0027DE1E87|nr:hypothetical protein [Bacteroides thetaiotaomicron]